MKYTQQDVQNDNRLLAEMESPPGISPALVNTLVEHIEARSDQLASVWTGLRGEQFTLRAVVGETIRVVKLLETPQLELDMEQRVSLRQHMKDGKFTASSVYLHGFWDGVGWLLKRLNMDEYDPDSKIGRDAYVATRTRLIRMLNQAIKRKAKLQ